MYIDLPSRTGVRSTVPWSLTSSPNLASSVRPISGWVSSRPRKRTVTLIRSPSSRNSIARWTFVVEVADADLRREADLLELDRALLPLGFLLALRQLVLVLPEVEKSDHRRGRRRRDLDEVEPTLLRHGERLWCRHHAELLALIIDDPHLWDTDHLVYAQVSADVYVPLFRGG